jgi:hypothetical protein
VDDDDDDEEAPVVDCIPAETAPPPERYPKN